jgi:NTE family protein
LTVGAVAVRSGALKYFDSRDVPLRIDHVLASAALPPAFSALRIDGEPYWDGGVYSNTPIEAVFDDDPRRSSIIFAVNVWQASGAEPISIWEVMGRQKDVECASRDDTHIAKQKELHQLRRVIRELARRLPASKRDDTAATWRATDAARPCTSSGSWPPRLPARTFSRTSTSAAVGSATDGRLEVVRRCK